MTEGEKGSFKRRDISARFTFPTPFCLPVLPAAPAFSLHKGQARTKKDSLVRATRAREYAPRAQLYSERGLLDPGVPVKVMVALVVMVVVVVMSIVLPPLRCRRRHHQERRAGVDKILIFPIVP